MQLCPKGQSKIALTTSVKLESQHFDPLQRMCALQFVNKTILLDLYIKQTLICQWVKKKNQDIL